MSTKDIKERDKIEINANKVLGSIRGSKGQPVSEFAALDIRTFAFAIDGYMSETPKSLMINISETYLEAQTDKILDEMLEDETYQEDIDTLTDERIAKLVEAGEDQDLIDRDEIQDQVMKEEALQNILMESMGEENKKSGLEIPIIAKVGDNHYFYGMDETGDAKLINLGSEHDLRVDRLSKKHNDGNVIINIEILRESIQFPEEGKSATYIPTKFNNYIEELNDDLDVHSYQKNVDFDLKNAQPENVSAILNRPGNFDGKVPSQNAMAMQIGMSMKSATEKDQYCDKVANQISNAGGAECLGFAVLAYSKLKEALPGDTRIQIMSDGKHNFVIVGFEGDVKNGKLKPGDLIAQKDNILIADLWAVAVGHKGGGVYNLDNYPLKNDFIYNEKIKSIAVNFDNAGLKQEMKLSSSSEEQGPTMRENKWSKHTTPDKPRVEASKADIDAAREEVKDAKQKGPPSESTPRLGRG